MATASQNYDYEISKLAIEGNSLTGSVNHVWKGEDKESVLSGLNSIKKERADEAMLRYLSNSNNDYQISDLKLSSTDNPDKDLTAIYKVDNKSALTSFGKSYYIDMDMRKELINSTIDIAERKHDFWFDYRMHIAKQTELTIPASYKAVNIPAALNIENPDYEFHIKYDVVGNKLIYTKNIIIKNTHLVTAKFAEWNKDIELLAKTYNQTITLKPLSE